MMKKLIVLGVVAAMCLSVAAFAGTTDTDWTVQLRAENAAGSAQGTLTLGTKATASDAFVPPTEDATYPSPVSGYAEIASTISNRVNKDYRAPVGDAPKVWDLLMYINGGTTGTITLKGWVPAAMKIDDPMLVVQLRQGNNVLFTFTPGSSGAASAPQYTGTFDFNGTPIPLQLVATVVPEPGSILALASGLVGLVGFGIRRRK